jgi:hypothetical protein
MMRPSCRTHGLWMVTPANRTCVCCGIPGAIRVAAGGVHGQGEFVSADIGAEMEKLRAWREQ